MLTLQQAHDEVFASYEAHVRFEKETMEKKKNRIDKTFLFLQECQSAGLLHDLEPFNYHRNLSFPTFHVTEKHHWKIIHQIVGTLESYAKNPIGDGRSRLVNVLLSPKDPQFAHITFVHKTRLPRNSKCKIVTNKTKNTYLVCSR